MTSIVPKVLKNASPIFRFPAKKSTEIMISMLFHIFVKHVPSRNTEPLETFP